MKKILALVLTLLALCALLPVMAEEAPERVPAETYLYTVKDEYLEIRDRVFEEDVTVSGNGSSVWFFNCEFRGDVILSCDSYTWVWIMPDCVRADLTRYVIDCPVREADMMFSFPKFALFQPGDVVFENAGGVLSVEGRPMAVNGTPVYAGDVMALVDENMNVTMLDSAEGVTSFSCVRWWENGEERCVVYTDAPLAAGEEN